MHVFTVRDAEAKDDFAVGELLVESFVRAYARLLPEVTVTERRKADLRNTANKRRLGRIWVCERAGELVGTVALFPPDAPDSESFVPGAPDLRQLAIVESARGSGASGALLDHAEAHARSMGAPGICLHARREARGIRALYEKRGYQRREEGDLDLLPEVFLSAYYLPFSR